MSVAFFSGIKYQVGSLQYAILQNAYLPIAYFGFFNFPENSYFQAHPNKI